LQLQDQSGILKIKIEPDMSKKTLHME